MLNKVKQKLLTFKKNSIDVDFTLDNKKNNNPPPPIKKTRWGVEIHTFLVNFIFKSLICKNKKNMFIFSFRMPLPPPFKALQGGNSILVFVKVKHTYRKDSVKRISMDTKATLKIGEYSRGGSTRGDRIPRLRGG